MNRILGKKIGFYINESTRLILYFVMRAMQIVNKPHSLLNGSELIIFACKDNGSRKKIN